MEYLDQKIISFLFQLTSPPVPDGFEVMNPFTDGETRKVCQAFYHRYYHDFNQRTCIIGINPGRFGAGITGIPFTDPIRLESVCGIPNPWPRKQELSSLFIYDVIAAFGGAEAFYKKCYITAVSPLGFTSKGKNINYYDNRTLAESVRPFALDCLQKQLSWGLDTRVAICLGEGKNFQFVQALNNRYHFFDQVIPLPHPRFIMQYKLKIKAFYIEKYLNALK